MIPVSFAIIILNNATRDDDRIFAVENVSISGLFLPERIRGSLCVGSRRLALRNRSAASDRGNLLRLTSVPVAFHLKFAHLSFVIPENTPPISIFAI